MVKKADFKNNLSAVVENKIDNKDDTKQVNKIEVVEDGQVQPSLVIEKKKKKRNTKKTFPVYMEEDMVNELDKICNKTGYNRNELINKMVEYSLKYIEFK